MPTTTNIKTALAQRCALTRKTPMLMTVLDQKNIIAFTHNRSDGCRVDINRLVPGMNLIIRCDLKSMDVNIEEPKAQNTSGLREILTRDIIYDKDTGILAIEDKDYLYTNIDLSKEYELAKQDLSKQQIESDLDLKIQLAEQCLKKNLDPILIFDINWTWLQEIDWRRRLEIVAPENIIPGMNISIQCHKRHMIEQTKMLAQAQGVVKNVDPSSGLLIAESLGDQTNEQKGRLYSTVDFSNEYIIMRDAVEQKLKDSLAQYCLDNLKGFSHLSADDMSKITTSTLGLFKFGSKISPSDITVGMTICLPTHSQHSTSQESLDDVEVCKVEGLYRE